MKDIPAACTSGQLVTVVRLETSVPVTVVAASAAGAPSVARSPTAATRPPMIAVLPTMLTTRLSRFTGGAYQSPRSEHVGI